MTVEVLGSDAQAVVLRHRFPFKVGRAAISELLHVVVTVDAAIAGERVRGVAADALVPTWFLRSTADSMARDLDVLVDVVRGALAAARELGPAASVFELWRRLDAIERERLAGVPQLAVGLGASLVERALIDAWCRATGTTLYGALRSGELGLDLASLHPVLAGCSPRDLLPEDPARVLAVRHTVGLGDPLEDDEAGDADDGLPRSLGACIEAYGLTRFKIKLSGRGESDVVRLSRVLAFIRDHCGAEYRFTVDANEGFGSAPDFRRFWESVRDRLGTEFEQHLLYVEQPLDRHTALGAQTAQALNAWADRPPLIIDESDVAPDCLTQALEAGYSGTTAKICKGVFRAVGSACLIEHRRTSVAGDASILSGEDLSTVGPVALLQDLALAASLGLPDVERNGHHYFRGLSAFPDAVQEELVERHGDLYRWHPDGFAAVRIVAGMLSLDSVVDAPFGVALAPDIAGLEPIAVAAGRSSH